MTTKQVRAFDLKLAQLFTQRTHWLKSLIRHKAPGAAPKFNKKKVDKGINLLQGNATSALLHSKLIPSLSDLYDQKKQWHPKRNKGRGPDEKAAAFKRWYERTVPFKYCVYLFWNKRRCLYIGRTLGGHGRPSSHFDKHWFSSATRIDVLSMVRKNKVAMLECIATHRHNPKHSKIKPPASKGFARCPICDVNRSIRLELKQIFRLK